MRSIDLNADIGEGCGDDEALLDIVTSANVACGAHAGDEQTMRRVVATAMARGVRVGAHVSYDDRANFGRQETGVAPDEIARLAQDQIAALQVVAQRYDTTVTHVKPHGALYHRVVRDTVAAAPFAEAMRACGVGTLLVQAPSPGADIARQLGVRVVAEAFADRAYRADGTLAPRSDSGALLTDAAAVIDRAVQLACGDPIPTIDGGAVRVLAESICVHGDTPGAVALAHAVRESLEQAGVDLRPFT